MRLKLNDTTTSSQRPSDLEQQEAVITGTYEWIFAVCYVLCSFSLDTSGPFEKFEHLRFLALLCLCNSLLTLLNPPKMWPLSSYSCLIADVSAIGLLIFLCLHQRFGFMVTIPSYPWYDLYLGCFFFCVACKKDLDFLSLLSHLRNWVASLAKHDAAITTSKPEGKCLSIYLYQIKRFMIGTYDYVAFLSGWILYLSRLPPFNEHEQLRLLASLCVCFSFLMYRNPRKLWWCGFASLICLVSAMGFVVCLCLCYGQTFGFAFTLFSYPSVVLFRCLKVPIARF